MSVVITAEEQRAYTYRRQYLLRKEFQEMLLARLIPSAERRREVKKAWKPLLPGSAGDTSIPRNRENV